MYARLYNTINMEYIMIEWNEMLPRFLDMVEILEIIIGYLSNPSTWEGMQSKVLSNCTQMDVFHYKLIVECLLCLICLKILYIIVLASLLQENEV